MTGKKGGKNAENVMGKYGGVSQQSSIVFVILYDSKIVVLWLPPYLAPNIFYSGIQQGIAECHNPKNPIMEVFGSALLQPLLASQIPTKNIST